MLSPIAKVKDGGKVKFPTKGGLPQVTIMNSANSIDVFPVREELLKPEEFLDLVERNPSMIERSTFIPPKLGGPGFGFIQVQYSRPKYRPINVFKPVAR
ncbi:MAG: hypothetical protein K9K35_10485 [Rhodoferax sp.]|nr:hypothetical protein [Rhodoferax sp.]